MGSPSFQDLDVPLEAAAGDWLSCLSLGNKQVHVFGTFSASLQVQFTVKDDDDPVNVGAVLTQPGSVEVPMNVKKVRIKVNDYVSGTPEAVLSAEE